MFTRVAGEAEIAEGQVKGIDVEGTDIVVAKVQGQLFAVDGICTHLLAFLSDGELDGFEIICPLHMGAFDLRTGAATREPCTEPLKCYPVRVEDGFVLIDFNHPDETGSQT
jgi:nitrite reductase/ring-hydroxylating ferredoxin subunit